MKTRLALAMVVCGFFLWFRWEQGRLHFLRSPASLQGNTCAGKRFCAVVYLAPWCPHCQAELPHVQTMLQRSRLGDTGVKVIVGLEQHPGGNRAMARKIASSGIVLDEDKSLAHSLGVQGVPAFFVLDSDGSKILEGQESYTWVMEKFGR